MYHGIAYGKRPTFSPAMFAYPQKIGVQHPQRIEFESSLPLSARDLD